MNKLYSNQVTNHQLPINPMDNLSYKKTTIINNKVHKIHKNKKNNNQMIQIYKQKNFHRT